MFKKALLLALLWPGLAWAQNPTCPTRPMGDSSNACASTAFVQGAVGAALPLPGAAGQLLNSTGIGLSSWLATVTLGQNGGTGGSLMLNGATSGAGTLSVSATGGRTQVSSGQTSGFNTSFQVADTISGNTVDSTFLNSSSSNSSESSVTVATGISNALVALRVNNGIASPVAHLIWGSAVSNGLQLMNSATVTAIFNNGLQVGAAPTGGDKGAGTINVSSGYFINGGGITGANLAISFPPQGRLTISTGVPVMTSTISAATTVYYTPYHGQFVPLWNGTSLVVTDTGGEISQLTTDNTKSPAAVTTNSNYDVFVWSDSGTIRATRGPPWTSDTARGSGAGTTQLSLQNGILLNTVNITNGPAALRGTYVGTIRSNGTSTIDFILGGSASGGTAGVLGVWNAYNRVNVAASVTDNGANYTYTTATIRQARASAGNQVSFVMGLAEDTFSASYTMINLTTANAGATAISGVGLDSTSTFAFPGTSTRAPTANVHQMGATNATIFAPVLGRHILSANELGDGANANTFDQATSNNFSVQLRM